MVGNEAWNSGKKDWLRVRVCDIGYKYTNKEIHSLDLDGLISVKKYTTYIMIYRIKYM